MKASRFTSSAAQIASIVERCAVIGRPQCSHGFCSVRCRVADHRNANG